MKVSKVSMAVLTAVAMMLSACSNETIDGPDNGIEERAARVVVSVNASRVQTKAIDDIDPDTDVQDRIQLKDLTILLFNDKGILAAKPRQVSTSLNENILFDQTTDPGLTTTVTEVMVIGNANRYLSSTLLDDFNVGNTTRSQVNATITASLDDLATDYDAGTIWVFGSNLDEGKAIVWQPLASGETVQEGSVSVTPNPIPARLDVKVNLTGITAGIDPADHPGVEIHGVTLLYSAAHTHLLSSPFIPSQTESFLYSGLVSERDPDFYTSWNTVGEHHPATLFRAPNSDSDPLTENILHASWTGSWVSTYDEEPTANLTIVGTGDDAGKDIFQRSFYALPPGKDFGREDAEASVILAVYGVHNKWEEGELVQQTPIFYSIHFNANEAAFGRDNLVNGQRYTINLNFNGDFTNGGGGTVTPEIPTNPAQLTVTINEAKWKPVIVISKDWNN